MVGRAIAVLALCVLSAISVLYFYPWAYELGLWFGNEYLYAFETSALSYSGKNPLNTSLLILFLVEGILFFCAGVCCLALYYFRNKKYSIAVSLLVSVSFLFVFLFGIGFGTNDSSAADAVLSHAFLLLFPFVAGAFVIAGTSLISYALISCAMSSQEAASKPTPRGEQPAAEKEESSVHNE